MIDNDLLAYISVTPALMSLLYDIDLLPEQARGTRYWDRMLTIAAHWREYSAGEAERNGDSGFTGSAPRIAELTEQLAEAEQKTRLEDIRHLDTLGYVSACNDLRALLPDSSAEVNYQQTEGKPAADLPRAAGSTNAGTPRTEVDFIFDTLTHVNPCAVPEDELPLRVFCNSLLVRLADENARANNSDKRRMILAVEFDAEREAREEELQRHYDDLCFVQQHAEVAQARCAEVKRQYRELLMQVGKKVADETRHQKEA